MIPKAANKNQKQAASWTLPFVTQQQRAAVNKIIGFYLFLPPDLLPKRSPNKHWHQDDSFRLPQSLSHPLLAMTFTAVLLYSSPSASDEVCVHTFL